MRRFDDPQSTGIQPEIGGVAARSGDTGLSADAGLTQNAPRDAVERALETSAAGWERVSSTARIIFSLVILVRFLIVGATEAGGGARAWLELPAIGGALAFSAWSFVRGRHGAPIAVPAASAVGDAFA